MTEIFDVLFEFFKWVQVPQIEKGELLVLGDIQYSNFTGVNQLFDHYLCTKLTQANQCLGNFLERAMLAMHQNQEEYVAFLSIKEFNIGFLFRILQPAKHERIHYRLSVHHSAKSLFKS